MINQIIDLSGSKNILIAGIGGGFDLYAGLPFFYELQKTHRVHLSSYSFASLQFPEEHYLNKVTEMTGEPRYFPEGWLADYIKHSDGVWQIAKLGVKPVYQAYKHIIDKCNIDTILLVDGGFDSLMHGDEDGAGTLLEDSVNLAALSEFNDVRKILITVGFGTEIEEKVCHRHVLENISELMRDKVYFGCIGMTDTMPEFQFYKQVYDYARRQPCFKDSHITSRIIPAVEGVFGGDNFLNPLMSLYWFFDADAVMRKNKLIPKLRNTTNFTDAMVVYRGLLAENLINRPAAKIPY